MIIELNENGKIEIDPKDWETFRRYWALIQMEMASTVSNSYVHGWRANAEDIQKGADLRAELGGTIFENLFRKDS